MGSTQSNTKESQHVSNETVINNVLNDKIHTFTWIMLAFVILSATLCLYVIWKRCSKGARKWVQKEIVTVAGAVPTVKVHAMPQQQQAPNTVGYA